MPTTVSWFNHCRVKQDREGKETERKKSRWLLGCFITFAVVITNWSTVKGATPSTFNNHFQLQGGWKSVTKQPRCNVRQTDKGLHTSVVQCINTSRLPTSCSQSERIFADLFALGQRSPTPGQSRLAARVEARV